MSSEEQPSASVHGLCEAVNYSLPAIATSGSAGYFDLANGLGSVPSPPYSIEERSLPDPLPQTTHD